MRKIVIVMTAMILMLSLFVTGCSKDQDADRDVSDIVEDTGDDSAESDDDTDLTATVDDIDTESEDEADLGAPVDDAEPEDTVSDTEEETDDSATTSETVTEYVKGTVTDTSFESESLNLRFTVPDNYIMATEEDIREMFGLATDYLEMDDAQVDYVEETSVYEMVASSPTGLPNIIVMTDVLFLEGMGEDLFLEALKVQLQSVDSESVFSEKSSVEIAGKTYQKLTTRVNMMGVEQIQDYVVGKSNDRMLTIITTYSPETEAEAQDLLTCFTTF